MQARDYSIGVATPGYLGVARTVMLDAVRHDFGSGFVPGWHGDITARGAACPTPARHALPVAGDDRDGEVAATAALDSRGPAHPPNPRSLANRYPSGTTAGLRRVHVRSEHRRRGLARRLVTALLEFVAEAGGCRYVLPDRGGERGHAARGDRTTVSSCAVRADVVVRAAPPDGVSGSGTPNVRFRDGS